MIDIYNKEEFTQFYNRCKEERKTDIEIAESLFITSATVSILKFVYQIESKPMRRNSVGVTEEDFKKGALLGLNRRLILRRVRDGMSVRRAITTPRKKMGRKPK